MKKKFKLKATLVGLTAIAAGAAATVPAVLPAQVMAATEATASTEATSVETITERKTVTWVIRALYKLSDGTTRPVKSQNGDDFKVTRSATFTRTVLKDRNTGKVISSGDWGTTGVKLDDYDAPVISGYISDKSHINGLTVYPNSKPEDTIIYYTQDPAARKTVVTESKDVTRRVTYYRINDDGSVTQTYSSSRTAHFTRTGTVDGNGKKEMGSWPEHTFAEEAVADIPGYTPDITVIPAVTFTPDNPPSDVKVYFKKNKEVKVDSKDTRVLDAVILRVRFTDGFGKTLSEQELKNGNAAKAPAAPKREGYTFAGWDKDFSKVTSSLTVNATWKANKTEWVTESRKVRRTVSYWYNNGSPVISTEGKPASEYIEQTFNRVNKKDTVTGKIISYGEWSPERKIFPAVYPVTVQGYTPDRTVIQASTVTPDTKSWEVKVYYSKVNAFTGVKADNGVWKVYKNGKMNSSFTGLAKAPDGKWYYFRNGVFYSGYTGLTRAASGKWYYVRNGRYDTSYTGMTRAESGRWYYVKNGNYNTGFTGLAPAPGGKWMYVKRGVYDNSYTGLARVASGRWYYVKKGNYDMSYSGKVNYNGKVYTVKNGKLV